MKIFKKSVQPLLILAVLKAIFNKRLKVVLLIQIGCTDRNKRWQPESVITAIKKTVAFSGNNCIHFFKDQTLLTYCALNMN